MLAVARPEAAQLPRMVKEILQAGRVKVTVVSTKGKEATITLLSTGDFVGEESMASVGGSIWPLPSQSQPAQP